MILWKILADFPSEFCTFNGSCRDTQRLIHEERYLQYKETERCEKKQNNEMEEKPNVGSIETAEFEAIPKQILELLKGQPLIIAKANLQAVERNLDRVSTIN